MSFPIQNYKKNMLKRVKTSIHCRLFWPISPTRAAPGRRGAVNGFLQEVGDDLTVTDMALNKEWGVRGGPKDWNM